MYGNTTLGDLIDFLEKQNPDAIVEKGFAEPHCDRGSYDELAFSPLEKTTFGEMLKNALSADGATYLGWKGGEFTMRRSTSVLIGNHGECGDEITPITFEFWKRSVKTPAPEPEGKDEIIGGEGTEAKPFCNQFVGKCFERGDYQSRQFSFGVCERDDGYEITVDPIEGGTRRHYALHPDGTIEDLSPPSPKEVPMAMLKEICDGSPIDGYYHEIAARYGYTVKE